MAEEPRPSGLGVDSSGSPVIDPTANVRELVEAAIKRQDDLRESESRHVRDIARLRAEYQEELRRAETERINAIRAVDVQAVQQASSVQETRATALAAQVAASAEAMRSQVAAAATAAATSLAAALEPVQKDIADLRRAQYEAQGKQTQVVDTQARGGAVGMWAAIAISAVVAIFTVIYYSQHKAGSSTTPGIICSATYHPSPCP
jgi:hypothetical protein